MQGTREGLELVDGFHFMPITHTVASTLTHLFGGHSTNCAPPLGTWILSTRASRRSFWWDSACMRSSRGSHALAPLRGLRRPCTTSLKRVRGVQCLSASCSARFQPSLVRRAAPLSVACARITRCSPSTESRIFCFGRDVRIRGAALDHSAFMPVLYSEVSKWLEMPSLSLSHEAVHLFLRGIQG